MHGRTKSTVASRIFALALVLCAATTATAATANAGEKPKNVILMIADGTGSQQYTFGRWWKGAPLNIEKHAAGSIRTAIADSVVADSAPAGTAFATGVLTSDKVIGVGPHGKGLLAGGSVYGGVDFHPLGTILEGARLLGKSTGVVATSRIAHATPASFYAHAHNRGDEYDITEMGVYANMDVVFGGGEDRLLPASRADGEDLVAELKNRGYAFVTTAAGMNAVTSGRVWGMFAKAAMKPEIDREALAPTEPDLAAMTAKALELLSQNDKGFFLMVEGSQIDWANHANDPAHLISDLRAWDEACDEALRFAEQDGNTLVLMFSDHDTGGFTIGNYRTDNTYSQMKLEQLLDPVRKITMSAERMAAMLDGSTSTAKVRDIVKQGWGADISESEARRIAELAAYYGGDASWAFGEVLSATQTSIGWSTHGHTGGDVPLGAYGVGKPEYGVYDEAELGRFLAASLGLDMKGLTDRLFVDAAKAFAGGSVTILPRMSGGRVVDCSLRVLCNGRDAEFFMNKNTVNIDGRIIELEGVSHYNQGNATFYIPAQAAALLTGSLAPLPGIAAF